MTYTPAVSDAPSWEDTGTPVSIEMWRHYAKTGEWLANTPCRACYLSKMSHEYGTPGRCLVWVAPDPEHLRVGYQDGYRPGFPRERRVI